MAIKQLEFIKNEVQEVVFTNFCDSEDYYLTLINGDITPLLQIGQLCHEKPYDFTIFTPYIPNTVKRFFVNGNTYQSGSKVKTLNDITPNLSKYIPEDNAVLFLSEEGYDKYRNCFPQTPAELFSHYMPLKVKYTIFLPHGTQSELQKANEVAKELKEKYGVVKVNLCVLHLFYQEGVTLYQLADLCNKMEKVITQNEVKKPIEMYSFNKIITTNSTGILEHQNTEHLQVIDCKEIFEEYLKENN